LHRQVLIVLPDLPLYPKSGKEEYHPQLSALIPVNKRIFVFYKDKCGCKSDERRYSIFIALQHNNILYNEPQQENSMLYERLPDETIGCLQ
jgi:hypothetical protein